MIVSKIIFYLLISVIFCYIFKTAEGLAVQYPIRSDVIVTKWPDNQNQAVTTDETKEPGWMRKQLMKFGEVASRVGNAMGAHATKITAAIDKVCEIVKTIIPFMAAVCHVGQFKFCGATTDAPGYLNDALSPTSLNLDEPDKRK